jgi:hypothetical protein
LEVPWDRAPKGTVGWDADPLSRMGTLLRHHRWAEWVFEDLTGAFEPMWDMAARSVRRPWNGRRVDPEMAAKRLAGLLPSLQPEGAPLRQWIRMHRPGLILSANVMGQFGPVAQALLRRAFHPLVPFQEDPEAPDPLAEALEGFIAKAVQAHLAVLAESGAELALVYDRAVIHGDVEPTLGPFTEAWPAQLRSAVPLEVSDPLSGIAPEQALQGLETKGCERWLWPVGEGQLHLVEARRLSPR